MKKHFLFMIGLAVLVGAAGVYKASLPQPATAQTAASGELFYMYNGQRIPLSVRPDVIVAKSKPEVQTRGGNPFYQIVQDRLQGSQTRGNGGGNPVGMEITPLGEDYAVVSLTRETQARRAEIQQKIANLPEVERILPVLTRSDRKEIVVLPNEIVMSFEPNLSESKIQEILNRQDLEIVRKLRFSQNRYLVRSKSASDTAILDVANRLYQVAGVKSAMPNFIQSISDNVPAPAKSNKTRSETPNQLSGAPRNQPGGGQTSFHSALLPLLWHLDSTHLTQCLNQKQLTWECLQQPISDSRVLPSRTDIRAVEAWQQGKNGGKGVVVAVIDSLIQWQHPDLKNNLFTVGNPPDKLPGEISGWDWAQNDADTNISKEEINDLNPIFKDTFNLPDAELIWKYPNIADGVIQSPLCQQQPSICSEKKVADLMRRWLRAKITAEFHGTWSAGVIAARSPNGQGLLGVAPNVRILPVRVFGLGGKITSASLVEAIGYAAARGADIINMSLGSPLPDSAMALQILDVQAANPNLVIVASAGNDSLPSLLFPAAFPGVVSVGATNLQGNRAPYSNFSPDLDVVAPGGDLEMLALLGGILTTGGTFSSEFWQGIEVPTSRWGDELDPTGGYYWVQGTSFSAPAVSGVFALMKGEDSARRLNREQLVTILKKTSSYSGLKVSQEEADFYQSRLREGSVPASVPVERFFFGNGLVNAEAAVAETKQLSGN